jgi:hypothetical protein
VLAMKNEPSRPLIRRFASTSLTLGRSESFSILNYRYFTNKSSHLR